MKNRFNNDDYDYDFDDEDDENKEYDDGDDDDDELDDDFIEGPNYYIINQAKSDKNDKGLTERILEKAIEVASQDFFWKFRSASKKAAIIELLYTRFMFLATLDNNK